MKQTIKLTKEDKVEVLRVKVSYIKIGDYDFIANIEQWETNNPYIKYYWEY